MQLSDLHVLIETFMAIKISQFLIVGKLHENNLVYSNGQVFVFDFYYKISN